MEPTDSPFRTVWEHGAGGSPALALVPPRDGVVILAVVARVGLGSRGEVLAGVGVASMAFLVWAWDTEATARAVGTSRMGRSNARPIARRARAGPCLTDRTRRTGWRTPCSGR